MRLDEIAEAVGGALEGDGAVLISGAASLEDATEKDICFIKEAKQAGSLSECRASAFIVPPGVSLGKPSIISENPLMAFSRAMDLLYPEDKPEPGVHPSAMINPGATLGQEVHVGPFAAIGPGTTIGEGSVIMAGAKVGAGCEIGPQCVIHENVVIKDGTRMGRRCVIHPLTVIGSDGFGYARTKQGESVKIRHVGAVLLEDDVEIGACSSVDRAMMGYTVIRQGVKIDNQVQIAHNVVIGENTIIAGCAGVAGSATIGKNVMIGGAAAVSDHVTVADGVMIAGLTGVHTNLEKPGVYSGPLAMPNMEYKRFILSGKRLEKLAERVKGLERKAGEGK